MPGSMNFNSSFTTNNGPQTFQPASATIASPIGAVTAINLASGANTISIPSGTSFICIQPPLTNTVALLLKQTGADVGLKMSKINPTVLGCDPSNNDTSFVINAASATTGLTLITFI